MDGPLVDAAFGPSSPSPGREPIVGTFEFDGELFTLIGNHFKSKGGDGPLYGTEWPPVRSTEDQRKAQAAAVRSYVEELFSADPDALIVVAGDMNDFQFAEPGEGESHPVGILAGPAGATHLQNVIDLIPFYSRYTYIYEGNSQVLDHMLLSPAALSALRGRSIVHFNAGYPAAFSEDASTFLRASAHDALAIRLRIGGDDD